MLEINLPLHVLLVMNNAPAHPPGLQDDPEEFKFIKIQFLPPNTTPLLQPIDQQVISNFKKLYTKALFKRCFEVTEGTNLTPREFWKYHFHIIACLKMIEKAWQGVTKGTLTSAWKKLWPVSIVECAFEGFEIVPVEPVVNETVSLAKIMGLEVDDSDIDELVEEHSQELTTEELTEFHCFTARSCGGEFVRGVGGVFRSDRQWIAFLPSNLPGLHGLAGKGVDRSDEKTRKKKKMLDDLGDRRGYFHLKEEALDLIKWRNCFGRDCGPVVLTDY
ncbi:hypothetical protein B7P43_G10140 [Cryptotermes secundus]|uniref:DDE-1 domain-containing protein n=1 Tax=Cryptotermes secundus TaxID=105785 RepID=A0A2J7RAD2_9NEOP|nr:hypothetical protein B7P43_G10140 [Cryptotermes secundus]